MGTKGAGRLTILNRKRQAEALERRQKIRQMILEGVRNQSIIAERLGVTRKCVCDQISRIYREWAGEDIRKTRRRARYRIKQFEHAAEQAIAAWHKSKENEERITTEYEPHSCPQCRGKRQNGSVCPVCEGKGYTNAIKGSKHVKGQSGDPALLAEYRANIREAARLEGLYKMKDLEIKQGDTHLHLHGEIDLSKLPPEDLMQLKRLYAKAEAMNGNVLEAPSENVDGED